MNPRLIKLASSEVIYANLDLINFIKQTISQPTTPIQSGDKLYFFKDVSFKRGLLDVAEQKFSRVIKLENATGVIINSSIILPVSPWFLKDNQIRNDIPEYEAEDTVFSISQYGPDFVQVIKQWFDLSQMKTPFKVVHEKDLLNYVNSGFVIDESNYDSILDLIRSDIKMAAQIVDTCKIEESFPYILYLIYFESGNFNSRNDSFVYNLVNFKTVMHNKGCWNSAAKYIAEIRAIPFLNDKMVGLITQQVSKCISSNVSREIQNVVGEFNVDFKWKQ